MKTLYLVGKYSKVKHIFKKDYTYKGNPSFAYRAVCGLMISVDPDLYFRLSKYNPLGSIKSPAEFPICAKCKRMKKNSRSRNV